MAKLSFKDGKLCVSAFTPPWGEFVYTEIDIGGLGEPDAQALSKAAGVI